MMQVRNYFYFFCLLYTFLFPITSIASTDVRPLQEDQAFALYMKVNDSHQATVSFHIAPGYYLYADRTKVSVTPEKTATITYPQSISRHDNEHGNYVVYEGNVEIPVSFNSIEQPINVKVNYQGCSAAGFCYPPTVKHFDLNLTNQATTTDAQPNFIAKFKSLLTDQNHIEEMLSNQPAAVLMLIFLGLGLLLAFTPCVLPMIPILTSIIVGQKHAPGSKKAFFLSSTYVLGMSITYAIAGLVAASLGRSLQVWLEQPLIIGAVSIFFLLLALSLFGFYDLRFSRRWHNWMSAWSNKHEGGTYAGVFFMGVISTLVVSPCVTAPLVGVLIYIGQTGNLLFGASALFAMGIGMGIPLMLIGMSADTWLPKSGQWMIAIKELFGIFMVGMSIWLLSRIVSHQVVMMLTSLLVLGIAVFVGIFLPDRVGMRKTNRIMGVAISVLGVIILINGLSSHSVSGATNPRSANSFVLVHNLAEINKQISLAQSTNQPILLDFYADWCASCVSMDKNVFETDSIKHSLNHFVLIRADLTANSAADEEIMKHFEVIAPPTVIFFNNAGKEVASHRIVGEVNAKEFITRLSSFTTASCDKNEVRC